jgi:hypothetical protein
MTEGEVLDATRNWIATTTGILWIDSYQGGPEPAEPYGVINLAMDDALNDHPRDVDYTDASGVIRQVPVQDWYWRFQLDVYGGAGKTILRKIKTAAQVQTAMEGLLPLQLAEVSRIADATEILNAEFQNRANMTVEVRGVVRDGLVISVIEEQQPDFARL